MNTQYAERCPVTLNSEKEHCDVWGWWSLTLCFILVQWGKVSRQRLWIVTLHARENSDNHNLGILMIKTTVSQTRPQNIMSVNWLQLMNAERKTRRKRPKWSAATQGHLMLNLNDSQKVEWGRMSVDVSQWNPANMKTESCPLIQTGAYQRRRERWFCCSVEPKANVV